MLADCDLWVDAAGVLTNVPPSSGCKVASAGSPVEKEFEDVVRKGIHKKKAVAAKKIEKPANKAASARNTDSRK